MYKNGKHSWMLDKAPHGARKPETLEESEAVFIVCK